MEDLNLNLNLNKIPKHVAIIMDGNGRWAKGKGLPRTQGHIEGAKRIKEIVEFATNIGIKILTFYAFSTENWNRPKNEVSLIMKTIANNLDKKLKYFLKENIKFQTIGRKEHVPQYVLKTIDNVTKKTMNNTGLVMNLAFNYGARLEIVDAFKKIYKKIKNKELNPDNISEETINQNLYTHNLPDPDLLIRTSGEKRISNFLLWQLSYSEFCFVDKYWPDFDSVEFKKTIIDYQKRDRRFGNIEKRKIK